MTIMQALRQWVTDVPNIAISILAASVVALVASALGREPDWPESIWFGLCAAGSYYHWSGLRELYRDHEAVLSWPEHDGIDLETIDNSIRRERTRLTAKVVFGAAGFIMMFVPPRVVESVDFIQQIVIVLLIFAVLALDVDAVMDRRSRRRQLDLIKASIARRQARREQLEVMFAPIFEALANETSERGRVLAHNINGKLSMVVGTVEILKGSSRLDDDERALILGLDETVIEICEEVAKLHELVRDLAIPKEDEDGSSSTAGLSGEADQPEVLDLPPGNYPSFRGLGNGESGVR